MASLARVVLVLSSVALSAPTAEEIEAAWTQVKPRLAESGRLPVPDLQPAHWEQIASGKVVRWRQPVDAQIDGAIGVGWVDQPIEQVWVGALDDVHNHLAEGLTEVWLEGTKPGHKVLYQHYDVPQPFSDRHWVVVVQNNPDLYEATEGQVWERTWDLDARGPSSLDEVPADTVSEPQAALWTPVNQGGWTLVPVGGGVLVVYQVRSDIGGNIPEELVVRFAMAGLDGMIDHLGKLAEGVDEHYVGDHFDIVRPDGSAIEPFEAP
jgi:hypothetical protein